MDGDISKDELKAVATGSTNEVVRNMALEKLKRDFEGDEVAQKMMQLSQIITQRNSLPKAQQVDAQQVAEIVRKTIEDDKISIDDLDSNLKSLLEGKVTTLSLTINTPTGTIKVKRSVDPAYSTSLIQKTLSDFLSRNNTYYYGMAGTGKTYTGNVMKRLLGFKLITINCNQYTSVLELIGGQTIDGYQEGKVIMAWSNTNPDGTPIEEKGVVLLLDELPKLDPNTAGVLNSALAKIGEFDDETGDPAEITNARGQSFKRKNIFIMATGNSKLNSDDSDYEANFKQDLSLQDRFTGSTYEVFINLEYEWKYILFEKWAFIFIYLNKLRELIVKEKFESKAFVSIRLMQSVQKTYNVFRAFRDDPTKKGIDKTVNPQISNTPVSNANAWAMVSPLKMKTVKDSLEEFFNLFTKEQSELLKTESNFEEWLEIVAEKNKFPLDKINTSNELAEIDKIIRESPKT